MMNNLPMAVNERPAALKVVADSPEQAEHLLLWNLKP